MAADGDWTPHDCHRPRSPIRTDNSAVCCGGHSRPAGWRSGVEDDVQVDLVIRNGQVVTADGRFQADIGIKGEKVVQLGGELSGTREPDARGLPVLPGAN